MLLPTDEEVARYIAAVRASSLELLKYDDDGWDDLEMILVKSKHKDYRFDPKDRTRDSDGDGMTDYEEMLIRRDPASAEPVYTKEQQIEFIRESRRQAIKGAVASAAEQARVRGILAPWMQGDVPSGIRGKVYSAEAEVAEKRQRMAERLPSLAQQQQDQLEAGKAAAARIGAPLRFTTPGGGDAVISGEHNGLPDYHFTRNTVSADTISLDELWPGGSTGLNLTGTDFGKPSVRLGVWEPAGPVLDHTEFADVNNTVDALDSAAGWMTSAEGAVALNTTPGNCQQGSGCLDLRKVAGAASFAIYSKIQTPSVNFTDRTVLVWYYIDNPATLAATGAVEIRFGSSATAYWCRSFDRAGLGNGWNLLSLKIPTATTITGAPIAAACNYTAVKINYLNASTVKSGASQGLDFWRLAHTRVTNMDRAATVADHSTHVNGTMAARGADIAAKGMAYTSEVHSRNSASDYAEMAAIFGNNDTSDDFFASNHSYGPDPGWGVFNTPGGTVNYLNVNVTPNTLTPITVAAGDYSIWRGTISISGQEDFRFGFYSAIFSRPIDQTVYSSGTLLPIWAAGNDRGSVGGDHFETDPALGFIATNRVRPADGGASGYDTMPPDSVAKNILTVGSVGDLAGGFVSGSTPAVSFFSDFGPTDDGRIKPDICANGESVYSAGYSLLYLTYNGTSQAAPSLVGASGLLVELLQRYRGQAYQPPASLLKCAFIHTADDILNPGPDYRSGYGQANAQRAANLILLNETVLNGSALRMALLQNGVTQSISVVATGGTPLKVTAVSTDPAGTPVADALDPTNLMLVNDFSLQVTTTGSGPFNPFILDPANPASPATTGVNFRDNVEQVLVSNPVAGQTYSILLGPAAGETFVNDLGQPSPQAVALAISGIQPDPGSNFRVVNFLQTGADAWTLVWPAVVGTLYRVQTSTDLTGGTWSDVTGDIAAAATVVAREVINPTPTGIRRFWRVRKVL